MRIAVLAFSASDEEHETMLAVKRAGMEPEKYSWNETAEHLEEYAGYILVGRFSSQTTAIPVLDTVIQVIRSQSHLGKPILGICHGAQILLETGLVPGVENDKPCITLTDTSSFQDSNVSRTHIRVSDHYQLNAFTRRLNPKNILSVSPADPKKMFCDTARIAGGNAVTRFDCFSIL